MKTVLKVALVALVIAAPMGAMSTEKGDIKYRQSIMKGIAAHAGAIAQIANGNVSHDAALQGHAHALLELTKMVPSAFKNKAGVGSTRAKADVWSDWSGFESKAGDMKRAATDVAEASKAGPAAVKVKLSALFDTCKGCHKGFRAKKKK